MLEQLLLVAIGFGWLFCLNKYSRFPSESVARIIRDWQRTNAKRVEYYPAM